MDPDSKFAGLLRLYPLGGILTKYYAALKDLFYKLSDEVIFGKRALVEPLSVVVNASKTAKTISGSHCVVFGTGFRGFAD